MIFARDPRALLCLNLRKEWAADQREIAVALERQAWCLDQARQSGWPVFHAHEARGRGVNPALRGALRGLAPHRSEPVFVVGAGGVFGNDTLQEALRACALRRIYVVGIGQSAALMHCSHELRVVSDAFVKLGNGELEVQRVESVEMFADPVADIVDLGAWRRERARASEGAK
jgi:hypothetical protein